MTLGLYIHIPFCEQRCHYCAFTVAVAPEPSYEPYVRSLVREIEIAGVRGSVDTIFFGGGTPSILRSDQIEAILRALPPGAEEVTIEANPGTFDDAKLEHYREIGINRISLGVQSFHNEDLENAGRHHKNSHIFSDFNALRKHGFEDVNLDLIAGLPGQRRETWLENLKWIDRLQPEHVSVYLLELEDQSVWGKRTPNIPQDDDCAWFYSEAVERLEAAGYVHYEISNWAHPGRECRHNQKYWAGVPYRGFGVSAHSFENGRRFWNTRSIREYSDRVASGELPVAGEEQLTPQIRLEEAFLLGLRQIQGFDVWRVARDLGIHYSREWFDRVERLEESGLVEFDGATLKLAPAGWLLANGVTEELLCPTLLSISEATP